MTSASAAASSHLLSELENTLIPVTPVLRHWSAARSINTTRKKGGGEVQGKTWHLVARLGPLHLEGGDVALCLAELHPDQVDGLAEVAVFFGIALVLDLGQSLAFRGVLQQLELE